MEAGACPHTVIREDPTLNIEAADELERRFPGVEMILLESGGDLEQALKYVDQSIAIKPTWWNNWVRAQILQKKGRAQDAVASGEKALQLGTGDRVFEGYFKPDVTKAVAEWKKPKP